MTSHARHHLHLTPVSAGAEPSRDLSERGSDEAAAGSLLIDCDRCSVRGTGCADCMVTVLLGSPPFGVALDHDEQRALDVLADAGLIPPLRMVESVESPHPIDGP
jgi:hypothetical protein